jgi:hypothetical protein
MKPFAKFVLKYAWPGIDLNRQFGAYAKAKETLQSQAI